MRKTGNVTLLVDPMKGVIDRILPTDRAMINNEEFMGFIEPIIDQHNLNITHFGIDPYGAVQINCLSDHQIKIPGVENEGIFFTGASFSVS